MEYQKVKIYCYSGNVIEPARVKTDESVPWLNYVPDVGVFVTRFSTGAIFLHLLPKAYTCPEANTATYRTGTIHSSYGVNTRRLEAEHSPPSNVEVKKNDFYFHSHLWVCRSWRGTILIFISEIERRILMPPKQ